MNRTTDPKTLPALLRMPLSTRGCLHEEAPTLTSAFTVCAFPFILGSAAPPSRAPWETSSLRSEGLYNFQPAFLVPSPILLFSPSTSPRPRCPSHLHQARFGPHAGAQVPKQDTDMHKHPGYKPLRTIISKETIQ